MVLFRLRSIVRFRAATINRLINYLIVRKINCQLFFIIDNRLRLNLKKYIYKCEYFLASLVLYDSVTGRWPSLVNMNIYVIMSNHLILIYVWEESVTAMQEIGD